MSKSATTGALVYITHGSYRGYRGRILSGPNETVLYRVRVDDYPDRPKPVIFLFKSEFETDAVTALQVLGAGLL